MYKQLSTKDMYFLHIGDCMRFLNCHHKLAKNTSQINIYRSSRFIGKLDIVY